MTGTPGDSRPGDDSPGYDNPDADSPLSDDVLPEGPGSDEGSDPNDPDGQMDDQRMPTTDGQMSSNSSEEVIPPRA